MRKGRRKKVKHVTGVFFTVTTRPKLFVLANAMIFVFLLLLKTPLLKKKLLCSLKYEIFFSFFSFLQGDFEAKSCKLESGHGILL